MGAGYLLPAAQHIIMIPRDELCMSPSKGEGDGGSHSPWW